MERLYHSKFGGRLEGTKLVRKWYKGGPWGLKVQKEGTRVRIDDNATSMLRCGHLRSLATQHAPPLPGRLSRSGRLPRLHMAGAGRAQCDGQDRLALRPGPPVASPLRQLAAGPRLPGLRQAGAAPGGLNWREGCDRMGWRAMATVIRSIYWLDKRSI